MNRNAKSIQRKSRNHQVAQTGPHTYTVTSGTSHKTYTVTLDSQAHCTCDWGKYRRAGQACGCSHVVSVYDHIAATSGRTVSAWSSEEQARRQHRPVIEIGDGLVLTARA